MGNTFFLRNWALALILLLSWTFQIQKHLQHEADFSKGVCSFASVQSSCQIISCCFPEVTKLFLFDFLPTETRQNYFLLCLQGISSGLVKRPRWYLSVELAVVQKLKHCTSASCGVTGCTLDSWVRKGLFPIKLIPVYKLGSVIAYSADNYGKSGCLPSKVDDPFILCDSLYQMLPQMTWSIWNRFESFWQAFPWWVDQHCSDLLW